MSLTIEEKRNLKTFWISLYGPQANQWPVNADMFDLTYKLLEESKKCSRPNRHGAKANGCGTKSNELAFF